MLIPLLSLSAYVLLQGAPVWQGRPLTADPTGTRRFFFELIALVTFGQLLLQATSNRRRALWLIYVTIGVVVGSAFFGLLRLILQHSSPDLALSNLPAADGYGQLLNRNYFASMLIMALGLDLGLVVAGGVSRKHLALHLGIIILLAASVVLTNSRGGIFAMMVLIVSLSSWFVIRRSKREATEGSISSKWRRVGRLALGVPLICCLLMAMALAVTKLGGDPLESRMGKLSAEVNDSAVAGAENARRADIWHASWRLIKANPFVGVGFGGYRTAIPRYHDASGSIAPETAINGYLDLLSGGGLIGCAIVAWFIVAFFWSVQTQRKQTNSFESAARLSGLAGLLGLAVHCLVDNALNVPINSIIMTVLIVLAAADWEPTRRVRSAGTRRDEISLGSNVLLRTGTMGGNSAAE